MIERIWGCMVPEMNAAMGYVCVYVCIDILKWGDVSESSEQRAGPEG